jgi:hypothetical protein
MKRILFWLLLGYLLLIPVFFLQRAYTLYVNPNDFFTTLDMTNASAWLAVKTLAARHVAYCFVILVGVLTWRKSLLLTALAMIILVSVQDGLILFNNPFMNVSERINAASIELFNILVLTPALFFVNKMDLK